MRYILILLLAFATSASSSPDIEFLNVYNFDEKVYVNEIVVVEFWAEWNSNNAYPIETLDLADVYRVDVDEERQLVSCYDVRSVPTIIIFKDGEIRYKTSSDISFKQVTDIYDLQTIIDALYFE